MHAHSPAPADSRKAVLKALAARHEQDDHWFKGGLHDPNGYVAMAHKDRGALLDLLLQTDVVHRQIETDSGGAFTVIPTAALKWLMGEGPDDRGTQFGGDLQLNHKGAILGGAYWWRTTFRRMCGL